MEYIRTDSSKTNKIIIITNKSLKIGLVVHHSLNSSMFQSIIKYNAKGLGLSKYNYSQYDLKNALE